ncbi:MAG: hypothetical protein ACO3DK_04760 [Bacteroidia bacterium]
MPKKLVSARLGTPRHKTLQEKEELIEKLNKELEKRNTFQAIHGLCMLCSLAAIPIGVLAGSQMASLIGIAWVASSFFSFSAESEKRHKRSVQSQIDFLNGLATLENELPQSSRSRGSVNMWSIGLN